MKTIKQHLSSKTLKALLILLYCILQTIGQIAGPLLTRLYYVHGGERKWLITWISTAGFPILIIPIGISYSRVQTNPGTTGFLLTPRLVAAAAVLGFLLGLNSYLYTFGLSYVPLSVSSLLSSTQIAFTAIFAFIVVKHKFTHYSINAVVLMILGSVILELHKNGERPREESDGKYMLGFMMTLLGAALHGFLSAALEYTHLKAGVPMTFDLVMQLQFLISAFSTLFLTVPVIINNDFQAIPKEASKFAFGEAKYYLILVLATIAYQLMLIAALALVFSTTALFGGIVTSLLVPVQQAFAVIFLPESFNPEKGLALAMCAWGFVSYFYGEYEASRKNMPPSKEDTELEPV